MKQTRRKFRNIITSIKRNLSLKAAEKKRIRRIEAVIMEKTQ
jgi:hypothetical protein